MMKKIVFSMVMFTGLMQIGAMAQTLSTRTSFDSGMITSIRTTEAKQTSSIRTTGTSWFSISSLRISE